MFEKYLKNKIIKLLIAVFILFLSLNLFLIIFFQFNNNIKKTRLFSSNKNINNSEKLKINIFDIIHPRININVLPDEKKKIFSMDPNLSSKEIILLLKEKILNQFQEFNQIAKSYVLSQEDANIKINKNLYYYDLPEDENRYLQKHLHTDPKLSDEETIHILASKLLSEISVKERRFQEYVLFLQQKLNHKMISVDDLNIKIILKNKKMPDILFYIMMVNTVLEETQYRITILNEQLKDDQKLQLLEHDFMNTRDWMNNEEKKILLIKPQISSQEMILILKEKIANQFRQRNQLAKYYDAIQQKALPILPQTKRYISDEDVYLQNIFNKHSHKKEDEIIEHLQQSLYQEYENKKSLLKLCDIVLNRQIFPQIYYINSNAMTFENHINEMDQLLNDPVYVSFIRIQLDDAIKKLMQLQQHIKQIQDQALIDLDQTQRELKNTRDARDKIKEKLNQKKKELKDAQNKATEDLSNIQKKAEKDLADKNRVITEQEQTIAKLNKDKTDLETAKTDLETAKNQLITKQEQTIKDKDQIIEAREQTIKDKDQIIEAREQTIKDRDQIIEAREQTIKDRDLTIKKGDQIIEAQKQSSEDRVLVIDNRDLTIEAQKQTIAKLNKDKIDLETAKNRVITKKEKTIKNRDLTIEAQKQTIAKLNKDKIDLETAKNRVITEQEQTIAKLNKDKTDLETAKTDLETAKNQLITKQEQTIKDKDQIIEAREQTIKDKDQIIEAREQTIKDRDLTIKKGDQIIEAQKQSSEDRVLVIDNRDLTIEAQKQTIEDRD
ncbi:MAG: hypothetical protein Q8778_02075, partial [Sweet potato little leaf phytoplasma]|nr:hypothetical protein [Sweet potato little leaf phytoplasma]